MLTAFVPHFIRPQFSVGISDIDETTHTGINSGDAVTFPGMDAGWPRADRLLIALIHTRDGVDDGTFTHGVTIGGVDAGQGVVVDGRAYAGVGSAFVGIYAAIVPTGHTVNVETNFTGFSGTFDAWGCTLIRATGLNSTTPVATRAMDQDDANAGFVTLNTSGAKFAVVACGEVSSNLSAVDPYSSSGGSVLTLGHRMQYGLAFLDTKPSGASTNYSIAGNAAQFPDIAVAACWG